MKRDLRIALMQMLAAREGKGWTCYYCECDLLPYGVNDNQPTAPRIEHKTPVARGGSSEADNLVLACHKCNSAKGTATDSEFKHLIELKAQGEAELERMVSEAFARSPARKTIDAMWSSLREIYSILGIDDIEAYLASTPQLAANGLQIAPTSSELEEAERVSQAEIEARKANMKKVSW